MLSCVPSTRLAFILPRGMLYNGDTVNSNGLPSTTELLSLFIMATVSQLSSSVSLPWPTCTVNAGLQ